MTVLVTGAAGFIGYHVSEALLAQGETVVGIDILSPYYDVRLKEARVARLRKNKNFTFVKADIAEHEKLATTLAPFAPIRRVVHLAAQAGVRYSLQHPFEYAAANVVGHLSILEFCRHTPGFEHLVYASSSSVYGGNTKLPFSVEDRVDTPVSLYAATKRADELMSQSYAHLYRIPQTGMRFFTVYGPWGRPDMALFLFTRAILAGEPIHVFNGGDMARDFTFIDDIVQGVLAALRTPPMHGPAAPHRVYNLGNSYAEPLPKLIALIEKSLGKKAKQISEPMQPGDVQATYADIEPARRDLGFAPRVRIEEGVPRFVAWYREYHGA
ncbi:MAG: NAD-dependent epimerase/dehydratase family protein [Alphaproteobacteria bacterium]|nr:NAD-dependent epimerase/dehydratase family protein [Alphaproteobacteria bacterium]